MCLEGRFSREGVAEFMGMPQPPRPLSPLIFTTIPIWAPLVSCPPDCRGYRSRTVAKLRRAWNSAVRWLSGKSSVNGSGTIQEKKWWEKPLGIIALGILVTVVGGLILWVVTRHYDKPTPSTPAASPTTQPQATQPEQNPTKTKGHGVNGQGQESAEQNTPLPKPSQHTATRAHGNSNVAGNNVSGDKNIIGNNNQDPTANAPNGIAIVGGTVTNPTVNNYNASPPPRRLTDEQRRLLVGCLSAGTGTFTVNAIMNNAEAYRYALDFSEVFAAAGWKNEQSVPVRSIWIVGSAWTGVHIRFPGTWDEAAKRPLLVTGSPELNALNCLGRAALSGIESGVFKDMQTGTFVIEVSEHP